MNISKRQFLNSASGLLATAFMPIPLKMAQAAQNLAYTALSENYIDKMIEAVSRIATYPKELEKLIADSLINPDKDYFAYDLAVRAMHGRGTELVLLSATDPRDRYLLANNPRFAVTLKDLALPPDFLLDDRQLMQLIFADAAYADSQIREAIPHSLMEDEAGEAPLHFLDRQFFPLEALTAHMPPHMRLIAHHEELCFLSYGARPRLTIRDAATLSQFHMDNCGRASMAFSHLERFVGEDSSYLGPHTQDVQRPFLKQISRGISRLALLENTEEVAAAPEPVPAPNAVPQLFTEEAETATKSVITRQGNKLIHSVCADPVERPRPELPSPSPT